MMSIAVLIQSHDKSTRLPHKLFEEIEGITVLERVISTCCDTIADEVIVATSSDPANNTLINFSKGLKRKYPKLRVAIYNGADSDVLSRFYWITKESNINTIVRITSDCPLISKDLINICIKTYLYHDDIDYLSFLSVDGMDVEVFSFVALERAYYTINKIKWNNETLKQEKEHVTRFIRESGMFSTMRLENVKLSIDTEQDVQRVRGICQNR